MNIAPHSSLCPNGVWMTEEDAMERHGINSKVMRLYRNEACPVNMYFEHGRRFNNSRYSIPAPYNKFQFVFISPEKTPATLFPVSLLDWSTMCEYFSNNIFYTDDDVDMPFRVLFEKYTNGSKATPVNIADAFSQGVLKHSSQLQNITPKKPGRPPNNSENNSNKKQKKTREETVDDLLPSEERLTTVVVNRLKHLDPKEIASDKDLSKVGSLMKLAEIDSLKFKVDRGNSDRSREVNMIFAVCQCGRNRVNEARKNQSSLCIKCSTAQAKEKALVKRRRDNAEKRVAANSCVPIATLTPEEIAIRMRNMKRERERKEQQCKRLKAKLNEYQVEDGSKKQSEEPKIIRITLQRPMGIVFAPLEELGYGVRIIDLPQHGAAAMSQQLCVGDVLVSVNEMDCTMSNSKQVLALIGQAQGGVNLEFLRSA
eukprot:scaffold11388_cov148-Skeletonema_menzelii.AAC.1